MTSRCRPSSGNHVAGWGRGTNPRASSSGSSSWTSDSGQPSRRARWPGGESSAKHRTPLRKPGPNAPSPGTTRPAGQASNHSWAGSRTGMGSAGEPRPGAPGSTSSPASSLATPAAPALVELIASVPALLRRFLPQVWLRWRQHVVRVNDPVGVPLLGQEPRTVRGEVGVDGVARDNAVEVRGTSVTLGPQDPPEPLSLLLSRTKGPRYLDGDAGLGQVDREVGDLADHKQLDLASAELLEQLLALGDRGLAGDQVGVESCGKPVELVQVLTDHQGRLAGVLRYKRLDDPVLGRARGRQAIAVLGLSHRVAHPLGIRQGDSHFDTVCRSDMTLGLYVLPGGVETLGPDQAEDVGLTPVLAHQCGGQAKAAAGLKIGRHPEDRRWQQVDLVVDDESPIAGIEQAEVGVDAFALGRQHLVGRDGDRPDLLAGTGVLADLVLGQAGSLQQFVAPLTGRDGVGDQDQGRGACLGHRSDADQGLTRATGQAHDP